MEIIKLSHDEAIKMIEGGTECYLVVSHDLEHDKSLGREKLDKRGVRLVIKNSKTIILNKDEDEEDSFSIMSMYSALQRDIFNIVSQGVKRDMMIFPRLE